MLKKILRLILTIFALLAALLGFSYFSSKKKSKYIELYSDPEETEDEDEVF